MKSFECCLRKCGLNCKVTAKTIFICTFTRVLPNRKAIGGTSAFSVNYRLRASLQWSRPDLGFCPQSITSSTYCLILTVGYSLAPLHSRSLLLTTSSCSSSHQSPPLENSVTNSARCLAPDATFGSTFICRLGVHCLLFLCTIWNYSCHPPLQLFLALTTVHLFSCGGCLWPADMH